MKKQKIIHYLKVNRKKVSTICVATMLIIIAGIAILFGIVENTIPWTISVIALFIVAVFGQNAAEAIINKIVDKNKKDIN